MLLDIKLRPLNPGDVRIAKPRQQSLEERRVRNMVGVKHREKVAIGALESLVEISRFVTAVVRPRQPHSSIATRQLLHLGASSVIEQVRTVWPVHCDHCGER